MTLADEDTNPILTDNANRAIQGNVAMQVTQPGGQLCKWCHLVVKFATNASGTTWIGSKFGHQVAPFALFAKLATRLRNLHCHIALDCPIGIIS